MGFWQEIPRLMLGFMLRQLVRKGTLTVTWHDGSKSAYGNGLPKAAMSIHGRWSPWTIGIRPDIALGEAYMDGVSRWKRARSPTCSKSCF